MKTKTNNSKEVVIVGYKTSANKQKELTTLILGLKEEIGLNYCGSVSSGFQEYETQHKLFSLLEPLTIEKPPLYGDTPVDQRIIWVKPVLVCEISYKAITRQGTFQDVEFLWLREDKNISEHIDKTG